MILEKAMNYEGAKNNPAPQKHSVKTAFFIEFTSSIKSGKSHIV